MVNFIWNLLLILLGQYVQGEIKRVDFRKCGDMANRMFLNAPIWFTRRTTTLKCIENCLYISNCVTTVSLGDGVDAECYLYDKQTVDMTNQVSSVSTQVFDRVADSSNDVTCLIRQSNLSAITPTTSTSTTPPPTTQTTTPAPTYLQYKSDTLTWEGARGACQTEGGDLAMLDTPQKIQTVKNTVTGYYVWAGFHQSTTASEFTWVDGRVVSGVNWKPGHPVAGDMCGLVAISGDVFFKTDDCERITDYICELPVV
ncbi:macrophage mannose receptor 1-like [Haliotis cracherodii]|uniref:macrophage mannose receptor 1-like n=1 Tax=Haliotis cracherodii TaxID=6455 RepID=UPI0039E75C95